MENIPFDCGTRCSYIFNDQIGRTTLPRWSARSNHTARRTKIGLSVTSPIQHEDGYHLNHVQTSKAFVYLK